MENPPPPPHGNFYTKHPVQQNGNDYEPPPPAVRKIIDGKNLYYDLNKLTDDDIVKCFGCSHNHAKNFIEHIKAMKIVAGCDDIALNSLFNSFTDNTYKDQLTPFE